MVGTFHFVLAVRGLVAFYPSCEGWAVQGVGAGCGCRAGGAGWAVQGAGWAVQGGRCRMGRAELQPGAGTDCSVCFAG